MINDKIKLIDNLLEEIELLDANTNEGDLFRSIDVRFKEIKKELRDSFDKRTIYDAIHHYWGIKGYITNRQLFDYLKIFLAGEDPFQKKKCLKLFAKQIIINRKVLNTENSENRWINGYTIKNEIFDKIYEAEFDRLQNLIGKTEHRRCDNCGIKSNYQIVLFTNDESEEAKYVYNFQDLRLGNLYWKGMCEHCGLVYSEIEYDKW